MIVYCAFHMLNWLDRALDCLKVQEKAPKSIINFVEVFYDVSVSLCQSTVEGRSTILSIFILRYGAIVTDQDVIFSLRLEAVRTINSMLDKSTKEERRKLCQSSDHCFLMEEFAKVILNIGDYEMQVAISEALCRMTVKKSREEFVDKWFPVKNFALSFMAINDKEFETDCRIFLNRVNSYFGNERGVFTFPCLRAFLDSTELCMPDDKSLEKFWVDFNTGSSCISFFVNDPESSLWESINLSKLDVFSYNLRVSSVPGGRDTRNPQHCRPVVCRTPSCAGACASLLARAKARVFRQSASSNGYGPIPAALSLLPIMSTKSLPARVERLKPAKKKRSRSEDLSESDSSTPFIHSMLRKDKPKMDYTRKKAKVRSKLKVLPVSSPSSNEEAGVKRPKALLSRAERHPAFSTPINPHVKLIRLPNVKSPHGDSGFREHSLFESTTCDVPAEEDVAVDLEDVLLSRKMLLETAEAVTQAFKDSEDSEDELGSTVISAFQKFKIQLKEHFSARYKRIEARSLQSLSNCQEHITSLLKTIHDQRLVHLEKFQATVVQQLEHLEQDCQSLRNIERETVSFWQSESQTVRSFCEQQQKRLESLDTLRRTPKRPTTAELAREDGGLQQTRPSTALFVTSTPTTTT
ncbi:synaptonemal complex protein 2-like isoform X3 [Denticeps clupeoides]|uniref:synaptonemal complex protein 2-like isoform X3 n=1 Tax=Denticeps clupeoides TaxID=299321 RepID=UPI0010A3760D|nr:synaptonemal complex protein 2-like isoform X3 [Denticeps clupeoides]